MTTSHVHVTVRRHVRHGLPLSRYEGCPSGVSRPPRPRPRPPHSSPFWNHLLGSGDKEASSPLLRSKVFARSPHRLCPLSQFAHATRTLVRGGPTRPHRPRLVVPHSTRPLSSLPPRAQLLHRSCSNKQQRTQAGTGGPGRMARGRGHTRQSRAGRVRVPGFFDFSGGSIVLPPPVSPYIQYDSAE